MCRLLMSNFHFVSELLNFTLSLLMNALINISSGQEKSPITSSSTTPARKILLIRKRWRWIGSSSDISLCG